MDLKSYKVDNEYVYEDITLSEDWYPRHALDKLKSFRFYDDDVLIATWPKAGTTWMQELAYLINTNGDFEGAAKGTTMDRGPYIDVINDGYNGMKLADELPRPRQMKTHLQYKIFQETIPKYRPKVIVVMRNLKDQLVSYYYFYRSFAAYSFPGTFSDFLELYKERRVVFGDWVDFYLGWWKNKDEPNFLFVSYEDMKRDIRSVVDSICKFLDKSLTPELKDAIIDYTSFSKMKDNDKTNYTYAPFINQQISPFMRKGVVGDWQTHFTAEQANHFDKLIDEKLSGTGLRFEC